MSFRRITALAAAVCLCVASVSVAGELEDQGRAVLEQYQKAVVTVQMVIKLTTMGSHEEEFKAEATGFVIDPTGLVVLSLATTSAMVEPMMAGMGENVDFKVETNMGDVKILLGDGTEIPAKVVLRDKDLDLAFVRPIEPPAAPMFAVDMQNPGEARVLDQLVSLTRLGKVANRECAASFERVHAIVTRPRTFYVPSSEPSKTVLGSPIFTPDGKVVGMLALRVVKGSGGGGMGMMFGGMDDNVMGVIVPTADILEAAKQAVEGEKT
ncbi:MAG TPA: serine protease [Candidatus Bathyarchaeia archaeon]|nr:serine protease [Candidatus Bathyarchaeia archaeon]